MAKRITIEITVKGKVDWQVRRSSTSRRWIATCQPLDLILEADSLDEMHSVIAEAIELLLTDLLLDRELDEFLRERGWTARNVPSTDIPEDVKFNLPWHMIAEGNGDPERRAH